MSKNITKDSLSEKLIIILAQMGIVGRRELSKVMYRQVGEEGDAERYGTATTPVIRKEDYLILTDKGWQYVDQNNLPYDEEMRRYSAGNMKNLKVLMRHFNAIYVGRSMRILSLGNEKPTYAEFATAMDSMSFAAWRHFRRSAVRCGAK